MTLFTIFLSAIILLGIIALIFNKDIFTRILFLNYISGIAILLICTISIYPYNSSYIDIAIIYSLLSFIASLGFLNYYKNRNNQADKK
jgi:multisubunit Na+/H+ antiporter MnhF subunit